MRERGKKIPFDLTKWKLMKLFAKTNHHLKIKTTTNKKC